MSDGYENVVCTDADPAGQYQFRYGPKASDAMWLAWNAVPRGTRAGDKGMLAYSDNGTRSWYTFEPNGTRDELYNTELFRVVEGVHGMYRYHLAPKDKTQHVGKSLCGELIMDTSVPAAAWGVSGHLREHWCEACREVANGAPTLSDGRALTEDHKALLAALDPLGGYTSRQLGKHVRKANGETPTAHSARVRKLLKELACSGMAAPMDDQKPICWILVQANKA